MTRRRIELEPAYVLAQRPYRETSLLVEAFTEREGRVGLVARGARGPRSKQRVLLQPFVPLLLSWIESGDLGTMTAVEAMGAPVPLVGERVFHGWYVNELLLRLLQRHDAHPTLYGVYQATLPALVAADDEPALRRFELRLLAEMGYGLDLPGDIEPGASYRYSFERGVERAAPGEAGAFSGATLAALRDGSFADCGPAERREARLLLRAALRRQLGGRELETPQLLRALRAKLPVSPESSQKLPMAQPPAARTPLYLAIRLGVNVDHVATVRQARGTAYPDPVEIALIAAAAGADSITIHLREDRRHIQDHDVERLLSRCPVPVNLEMAVTPEMIGIACRARPRFACLVPERREERTTEGGLDVTGHRSEIADACARLREAGIAAALFIDPDPGQLDAVVGVGVPHIEIHTGAYADAADPGKRAAELKKIATFAHAAHAAGVEVHAGHGLNLENVGPVAAIPEIVELNIGHALIADALAVGMPAAVAAMRRTMIEARRARPDSVRA